MNLAQHDSRSPRLLTTFRHPLEAEQLANQLRENGIEALTTGSAIATGAIEFAQVDVQVLVPSEQLELARKVLADSQSTPPVNWDEIEWPDDEPDEPDAADATLESTIGLVYPAHWKNGILGKTFVVINVVFFVATVAWVAFMLFGT